MLIYRYCFASYHPAAAAAFAGRHRLDPAAARLYNPSVPNTTICMIACTYAYMGSTISPNIFALSVFNIIYMR